MCLHLLPPPGSYASELCKDLKESLFILPLANILFHNGEYFALQDRVTELGESRMGEVTTKYRQLGMVQPRSRVRAGYKETVCHKAAKNGRILQRKGLSHTVCLGDMSSSKRNVKEGAV